MDNTQPPPLSRRQSIFRQLLKPKQRKELSTFITVSDQQEQLPKLSRRNTILIPRKLDSIVEEPRGSFRQRLQTRFKSNNRSPLSLQPQSPASGQIDMMTELHLDSVPADVLDVGSCQSSPAVSRKASPPANDKVDDFYKSTSLFTLFEDRLTSLKKADDFRQTESDVQTLRRSKSSIIVKTRIAREESQLRKVLLKRPFTVNAGKEGRNKWIESIRAASIGDQVATTQLSPKLARKKTIRPNVSRPTSTDSGFSSLRQKLSKESFTMQSSPLLKVETAQSLPDSSSDVMPRTQPVSPKRRNVASIIDEASSLDVPLIEEMSANCKRIIIAGDLEVLTNILINPAADDYYDNFTSDFMLSYRYFLSEQDMFEMLKDKFQFWSDRCIPKSLHLPAMHTFNTESRLGRLWILPDDKPIPVLMRIMSLIQEWIDVYCFLDFFAKGSNQETQRLADLYLLNEIASFVENNISCHRLKQVRVWNGTLKQSLNKLFDAFSFNPNSNISTNTFPARKYKTLPATRPRKGTNPEKTHAKLLSLKANDIFTQLTLLEMEYFLSIRPLDLYYKSKGQLQKAKRLQELIERFNNVSYWVATEICMCRDVRQRAEVIKLFIKVAKLCFKWHNYNTCLQIVAALSMTCVRRLKKTWHILPRKYESAWRELSRVFSASCNYSTYRKDVLAKLDLTDSSSVTSLDNSESVDDARAVVMHGGIPFVGIHLSDLVFIEEAHGKDILDSESSSGVQIQLINFTKMRLVAQTFRQLVQIQKVTSYSQFKVEPFTLRFLKHDAFALDEDKLWKASKIIEPADDFFDEPINVTTMLSVPKSSNF